MPKYPKTTKIELWRTRNDYQDESGAWHTGRPTQIATYWCHFKGVDFKLLCEDIGRWSKPLFSATITRPKRNQPQIGDHVRYNGSFYIVKQVNDLSGEVGHDMKLVCEHDAEFRIQS